MNRSEKGLRIVAEGQCQASWRFPVVLEPGRYRFEARVQTRGIVGGEGAGLRISGQEPVGAWLTGTQPRAPLAFEFDAPDNGQAVLVAELRPRLAKRRFRPMTCG